MRLQINRIEWWSQKAAMTFEPWRVEQKVPRVWDNKHERNGVEKRCGNNLKRWQGVLKGETIFFRTKKNENDD